MYTTGHSTETVLVSVKDPICKSLDHKKAVFFISLDLSAAFDTIDQDIMSTRFREMYGIPW